MFSFKRSLMALVGMLVVLGVPAALMPLVGREQSQGQAPFAQRNFFLTLIIKRSGDGWLMAYYSAADLRDLSTAK
jgi:hypothetical protein